MSTTVKPQQPHQQQQTSTGTVVHEPSYEKYQEETLQPESVQSCQKQPLSSCRRSRFQQVVGTDSININKESVRELNELVNLILKSDLLSNAMAYYFDRAEVGLYGVADFFRNIGLVKCKKAKLIMDYLMVRGAQVIFDDIEKPERTEWATPLEAFQTLLGVQTSIYKKVLACYETAEKQNDASLTDFLEEFTLRPLSLWIRRINVIIANAERAGPALGTYQLNKHLCYNMKLFFETDKEITEFLELPI